MNEGVSLPIVIPLPARQREQEQGQQVTPGSSLAHLFLLLLCVSAKTTWQWIALTAVDGKDDVFI
jgi:hypothetical protein